jgi:hypothetical protein
MAKRWNTLKQILLLYSHLKRKNSNGYLFESKGEMIFSEADSYNPDISRKMMFRPGDITNEPFKIFHFFNKTLDMIQNPVELTAPFKEEKLKHLPAIPTVDVIERVFPKEKDSPVVKPKDYLTGVYTIEEMEKKLMVLNDEDFLAQINKLTSFQSSLALPNDRVFNRLLHVTQKISLNKY